MKNNSSFGIGMTYAGCYLGAGYVSGQELWQYFGRFGLWGFAGLLLTMLLFFLLGAVLYFLVNKTRICAMDKIIVLSDNKWLLSFVSVLQIVYCISIVIIMVAGVSSLLESVFDISKYISAALFCGLIYILALKGIDGLVKIFSATVPFLVVFAVIISIAAFIRAPESNIISPPELKASSFLWIWSSAVYMSFNFFGCIGIMAPVDFDADNKKIAKRGLFIGTAMLFLIAFSIILALLTNISFVGYELPMLELSFSLSSVMGYIYAVLLFFAMMGTALSSIVAADNYLNVKSKIYCSKRSVFLIVIIILCFAFSLFGFGELIGTVYPIFGVLGFAAIALLLYNFFKIRAK